MHSSQILSILAFASTTLALPQWGSWGQGKPSSDNDSGKPQGNWGGHGAPEATVTAIATATAYTTVVYGGNWGGHAKPTAAPATPEADSSTWASWSAPAASASAAPISSGNGGYMDIVNEYRSKMGHPTLTEDSQLQANALKTAQDGNGQMVHELNDGSMAQVLAPGNANDFSSVYIGGWLCEVPSASGLDGICNTMSAGWSYEGQTGHADILNSKDYSKIGCACATGIWACDLA